MAYKEEGWAVTVELVAGYFQHDVPDRLVEAFHLQNRLPPRLLKSRPPGRLFDPSQTVSHPFHRLTEPEQLLKPVEKNGRPSRDGLPASPKGKPHWFRRRRS